jgi:hypothetical protein
MECPGHSFDQLVCEVDLRWRCSDFPVHSLVFPTIGQPWSMIVSVKTPKPSFKTSVQRFSVLHSPLQGRADVPFFVAFWKKMFFL